MTIESSDPTIVSEEETQWAGKSNPDNGSNIQEQVFSAEKSQEIDEVTKEYLRKEETERQKMREERDKRKRQERNRGRGNGNGRGGSRGRVIRGGVLPKKMFDMEEEHETITSNIKHYGEKFISQRVRLYDVLLDELYFECKLTKDRLDLYQGYLYNVNTFIQISVISVSIAGSFVQALSSKSYDIIFDEPTQSSLYNNETGLTETIIEKGGEKIDQDTYSRIVPIITLCFSTWSAFIISLERHFSFEEREGNVNNLKELYSELISRIKYYRELLKPWFTKDYYENEEEKNLDWEQIMKRVEKEYTHIVDIKRELTMSYEKIVDTNVYKKYEKMFPKPVSNKRRSRTSDIKEVV
jgi:hypothetical protein